MTSSSCVPSTLFFISLCGVLAISTAEAQTFGAKSVVTSSADGANCLIGGDIDGDGLMDLIGTTFLDDQVVWYRQTSKDVYSPAQTIGLPLNGAWNCVAADIDGDLDLDIVASGNISGEVILYENLGAGASWSSKTLTNLAPSAAGLAVEDLDQDGDLDILATSLIDNKLWRFTNMGGLTFISTEHAVPKAWTVAAFDFDGDGDRDIIVGGFTFAGGFTAPSLYKLENRGSGTFGQAVIFASGIVGPSSVWGRDIDGDGILDVLCSSRIDSRIQWLKGDGAGNFGPKQTITSSLLAPYQSDAVDLDNDGDLDVFVAASLSGKVAWFEALGSGSFGVQQNVDAAAPGARYVSLEDMDSDGDFDLLAATVSDDVFSIHKNILAIVTPQLQSASGLHSLDSGKVRLKGTNLLGATVLVDGVPASVTGSTETLIVLDLLPDEPGRMQEITLTNSSGTTVWPDSLARYPALVTSTDVALNEALTLTLDNGDAGLFGLAFAGAIHPSPLLFPGFGWFHGLELNGLIIIGSGAFTASQTVQALALPVVTQPALVGTTFYLQAWASQRTLGYAGFSGVRAVTVK